MCVSACVHDTMSEDKVDQNGTDDAQDKKARKTAKHDGGVADLERVTDYAEEKELSSADISNVSKSLIKMNLTPTKSGWLLIVEC